MDTITHHQDKPAAEDLVRATCALIEDGEETAPTLAELGRRLRVSPFHLQRTFKRALGVSPREYAEATRLERFKLALRAGGNNVATALYEAGYGSSSRLYETAKLRLGMTPASYGKGGRGAEIVYAIVPCRLGLLLVGATHNGVCRIAFGDSESALDAELAREYPLAAIRRDQDGLDALAEALARMIDAADPRLADLPLDVQASAFQAQVWGFLRAIPPGETRSYSEIARALGVPAATRAVARACATNPVAVAVPCHRAIGADGSLRGYRWGLERKRSLLERERVKGADR